MKPLGIFAKLFISTFSVFSILVISLHLAIYWIFPSTYLSQGQEKLVSQATAIAGSLEGKDSTRIQELLDLYSQTSDIKASIKETAGKTSLEIRQPLPIDRDSQTNSLVIEERSIQTLDGSQLTLQFVTSMDLQKQAENLSLRYLPYTLLASFLLSLVIAYLYARAIVAPILEIKRVTRHMMDLDKDIRLEVHSQDEIGDLKEQINQLYQHLLTAISDLSEKNQAILKLERMKVDFLRGASHELKTPLASLHILLENMQYRIGRYKDRDHYLGEARAIVDQLSHHVGQILSLSSVQNLEEKRVSLDLKDRLDRIIQDYQVLAKKGNINLDNQAQPQILSLKPSSLNLILSNLISNAIKHSTEKSTVRIYQKDGWLAIENTAEEGKTDKLLAFFSKEKQENSKGTGLGLFVLQSLLEHEKLPYRLDRTDNQVTFWIDFSQQALEASTADHDE